MRFGTRYRGFVDQVEASTTGLICASPVGLLIPFLQVGDRAQSPPTLRHWHGPLSLTKESKTENEYSKIKTCRQQGTSCLTGWSMVKLRNMKQ